MSTYTATTVPTQFVEAHGIRFAYRRWGTRSGLPLVFNQHFTGNLDNWDPAVLDGLAKEREVIIFNNAGVASSTGADCSRWRMGFSTWRALHLSKEHQAAHACRERQPRCHCLHSEFALSRSEHAKCQANPLSRRQPRIVV